MIEAIDGPMTAGLPSCEGTEDALSNREAKLRQALEQVTLSSRQQLQAVKLSDLMDEPRIAQDPDVEDPDTEPSQ